jgi:hypothetical protein
MKPNTHLKEAFDLVQTMPEWGSTHCIPPKEVLCPVFCPNQPKPKQVIVLPSKHSPNPLGHQANVHSLGIHHSQAPLAFRLTKLLSVHSMELLFGSLALLEEPVSVLVEALMSAIGQQKQGHRMKRKVG